ncbi:hypothetical protein CVT26_005153 [Gymnopilus dilepis]|uniref:Uncharacterized protein n=1 Tax=Gymnopilus dilepis TaxID=231916 RepID=A0A409WJ57_9AGAR|nr:hypothetical protein CVT26_005153 [Gymnopilus dilepis]
MRARMGRAVYVSGGAGGGGQGEAEERREQLPPDPGAWGVAAILEGILEGVRTCRAEMSRGKSSERN